MNNVGPLVATGRTSDVYEYGADSVVKVPYLEVPDHWAAMEARFTAAVVAHGLPAPEVRDVVKVGGRDAIVFARIDGSSLWQMVADERQSPGAAAETLAEVHTEILRAGLPSGVEGMVGRTVRKLRKCIALDEAEREAAQHVARTLPKGAALLHGDLHPGNVLMSAAGPVVIDWFDAAIGHPVADIVRSSVLMRWNGPSGPRHLPGADAALLAELHDAYVARMASALHSSGPLLQEWEAVVAASRLTEGAEWSDDWLVELWRQRSGQPETPLTVALAAAS